MKMVVKFFFSRNHLKLCVDVSVYMGEGEPGGREKGQCVHPGGSGQNGIYCSNVWM